MNPPRPRFCEPACSASPFPSTPSWAPGSMTGSRNAVTATTRGRYAPFFAQSLIVRFSRPAPQRMAWLACHTGSSTLNGSWPAHHQPAARAPRLLLQNGHRERRDCRGTGFCRCGMCGARRASRQDQPGSASISMPASDMYGLARDTTRCGNARAVQPPPACAYQVRGLVPTRLPV